MEINTSYLELIYSKHLFLLIIGSLGIISYLVNLSNRHSIDIHDIDLEKGDDFTLPSGLFKGFKGKILNLSKNKLKLELKNIGLFMTVNLA